MMVVKKCKIWLEGECFDEDDEAIDQKHAKYFLPKLY